MKTIYQFSKTNKARRAAAKHKSISPWREHRLRLLESYERLKDKGLIGDDRLGISVRVPGQPAFAFLGHNGSPDSKARKKAKPRTSQVAIFDFQAQSVPHTDGQERFDLTAFQDWVALHAEIYSNRLDVGAIVINRPEWGGALAMLDEPMPGIFDEQARQMGSRVERLSRAQHNEREARVISDADRQRLRKGANVFLYEDHALCLGMTRERAIFNSELLEKCAKAYVLALATGQRIRRIPWFVRFIANRRLLKDEQRSAESYARGEVPTGFTAY
ncbi:MAG: class II aldolase/adducin family protein [bacterium]|nr:class II aldolase/adducin family protein [bacterium]